MCLSLLGSAVWGLLWHLRSVSLARVRSHQLGLSNLWATPILRVGAFHTHHDAMVWNDQNTPIVIGLNSTCIGIPLVARIQALQNGWTFFVTSMETQEIWASWIVPCCLNADSGRMMIQTTAIWTSKEASLQRWYQHWSSVWGPTLLVKGKINQSNWKLMTTEVIKMIEITL